MRMRKRNWVDPLMNKENELLIKDHHKIKEISNNFKEVYLEIGSGLGHFILELAMLNPDKLYFAFEKDYICSAKMLKLFKANKDKLNNNLFIINDNAINLQKFFTNASIDGIYLLFSDPWPKKGHHKRRLSAESFLKIYYDLLKDNGYIYQKTDNFDLYDYSKLSYQNSKLFQIIIDSTDFHNEIKDNLPLSAYEQKFLNAGNKIYHLKIEKLAKHN